MSLFPLLLYIPNSKFQISIQQTKNNSKNSRNMFNYANNYYYYCTIFFFYFACCDAMLIRPSWFILLLLIVDRYLRIPTDSLWMHDTVNLCDNEICRPEVHQTVNKKSIHVLHTVHCTQYMNSYYYQNDGIRKKYKKKMKSLAIVWRD